MDWTIGPLEHWTIFLDHLLDHFFWTKFWTILSGVADSSTTAVTLLSPLTPSSGPMRSTKILSCPSIQRTAISCTSYYRSREYCVYFE